MRLLLIIALSLGSLSASLLQLEGLPAAQAKEVLETLEGRLYFVKLRPANPSRADDAAFLVKNFLRTNGSPNAEVTWSLPGNDTILLQAKVGTIRYLGGIYVKGWPTNDIVPAQEQFLSAFQIPKRKSARLPYHKSAVLEGTARVGDLLKSNGYWSSTLEAQRGTPTPDGTIPVTLLVNPGPLFTLREPILLSPIPPRPALLEEMAALDGKNATTERINRIRLTIAHHYRQIGYPDIELTQDTEIATDTLRMTLNITPGPRYNLRTVKTAGLQKTDPEAVLRPFRPAEGKPYDESVINDRIKKLISTGAFSQVRLEEEPLSNGQLDATLHLKETNAKGISLSAGLGSFEGLILGARYFDRNLNGTLKNLNAGVEVTSLGLLGEVSLQDPFFLGRDLNFTQRAYLITREFEGYSKSEGGIGAELTFDQFEHYSATVGLQGIFASVQSEGLPIATLGPRDYFVTSLYLNQSYDRRDDPALPSDGWYAGLDTALGLALKDESVGYFSMEGQLSYYDTRGSRSAVAANLRSGFILPTGNSDDLPIDLRQFEGGSQSVRSFAQRDMGPNVGGYPAGGTAWWIANAEYIRTLKGPLKGVLFFDAGTLSKDPGDLFSTDIEMALGLGLRIDLPVGPIRLEYGHSLTQDPGEHSGTFHFSIGATF
ncbi:MAG: BamA/OMP85 family outer membrane protein [Verrucomicrobiaceae bacterium]